MHLVGVHYNEFCVRMNQYAGTFDKLQMKLMDSDFNSEDNINITVELVIGKLKNLDENMEKLEDALFEALRAQKKHEIITPRIHAKNGDLVVGFIVPAPIKKAFG